MQLHKFPMDDQFCRMEIGSCKYGYNFEFLHHFYLSNSYTAMITRIKILEGTFEWTHHIGFFLKQHEKHFNQSVVPIVEF